MAPLCRFCVASAEKQEIKGRQVFGGTTGQHFWECASCGMIYLDPPLTDEEEKKFYNKEFEKFMSRRAGTDMDWTGPEQHVKSNQREVERRLPFLLRYLKSGHHVLELGCSSGFMLSALREKGLDVTGLDPSGGFLDYVKSKGISIYQGLEDLRKSEIKHFDAIIHYYVLEHIRDPLVFLHRHMDLLAPGGVMIFEVPCALDPLLELYKVSAFDAFYWSVAHHWYFTPKSLGRLLEDSGYNFELFPEQRYDISNHMTWMLEGKPGGYGRWSDVFGPELDALYKQRLKDRWICDTIIAVVKKMG